MSTKRLDDYNGVPPSGNLKPSEETHQTPTSQDNWAYSAHSHQGLCPRCGNEVETDCTELVQNMKGDTITECYQYCLVCAWESDYHYE
jgi:hypothetical protein